MPYDSGAYGRGWSRLRRLVLDRDGWECRHCGVTLRRPGSSVGAPATVDHYESPVAELLAAGERVDPASVDPAGLVASCRTCNARRGQVTKAKIRGRADGPPPGPRRWSLPTGTASRWEAL